MHGLDVGFNSGKGKILQSWTQEMAGELIRKPVSKKEIVTERTLAFFDSLPKFTKEEAK